MLSLSSFSLWIELGIGVTFLLILAGLFGSFLVSAGSKSRDAFQGQKSRSSWFRRFRKNERRIDRVPCSMPMEMRDRTQVVKLGNSQILNLSNSGACMVTRVILSLGERIQGCVKTKDNTLVKISGMVVWKKPTHAGTQYGIRFI